MLEISCDASASHHKAVVHYHYTFAQLYAVEANACESGHYEATVSKYIVSKQFLGERIVLVGIWHSVVQLE